jgi:hypothetical protein
MGYMQTIETALRERLAELPAEQQNDIIRFIKEKLLESYKNGMDAAKTDKTGQQATQRADYQRSRRK